MALLEDFGYTVVRGFDMKLGTLKKNMWSGIVAYPRGEVPQACANLNLYSLCFKPPCPCAVQREQVC